LPPEIRSVHCAAQRVVMRSHTTAGIAIVSGVHLVVPGSGRHVKSESVLGKLVRRTLRGHHNTLRCFGSDLGAKGEFEAVSGAGRNRYYYDELRQARKASEIFSNSSGLARVRELPRFFVNN
jgi:hypothetical protein